MTKVKICGLTKAEDAITAAAAGADLLGFIMAESRRRVTIGQARDLVQAVKAHGYTGELVGVFVNEPADTINQVAAYAGFGRVQLSGDETPEDARNVNIPIIKVIRVSPATQTEHISAEIFTWREATGPKTLFLLDTAQRGAYGGTGKVFNWQVAAGVAQTEPIIVAGGLTPKNVAELVLKVKPFGADVSSGVETGGLKDGVKIAAFVRAAKMAGV
ncbi:phosphoribosylanthranilate isomerase [Chloroflexota bacterium]